MARSPYKPSFDYVSEKKYDTRDIQESVKYSDKLLPVDRMICGFLAALAIVVRLYKIWQPNKVVFDEVHFGKFAARYIKGQFFVDVHPPLAKMLYGLVGWLAGFDGSYLFDNIGDEYKKNNVPYVTMRLLPAILGVLTIPMSYYTVLLAGGSRLCGIFAASMVTFENALITQSRFILLDSPLVFATALCVMAFRMFQRYTSRPFRKQWISRLYLLGVGLGIVSSIKWVGLFTIAWVGLLTIIELWSIWSDVSIKPKTVAKHISARAITLILLPFAIYVSMFAIQFTVLRHSGDGDGFMSPEFRISVDPSLQKSVPADVLFGSKVTIRHWNTDGGFLHSHPLDYETGSKQQQITLYPHMDNNNDWKIESTEDTDYYATHNYIKNGDRVKLLHLATSKRLHSHNEKPPMTDTDYQFEVSCYGFEGFEGDANDIFEVEIIQDMSKDGPSKTHLRTLESKFRLRHVNQNCYLFSHKVKLPKWASEQQEVTCNNNPTFVNSVWYIEENEHPLLDSNSEMVQYKPLSFWGKFKEYNKVMWRINKDLTDSHEYMSRPQAWPILKRGISFYDIDNRQIYLLGNPLIWLSSTVAVGMYIILRVGFLVLAQAGVDVQKSEEFQNYENQVGVYVLGWLLHFLPFFLMKRQLFIHHYLPALYFAILALAHTWDIMLKLIVPSRNKKYSLILTVIFLVSIVATFYVYSPIAYGDAWKREACERTKLFRRWDYNCH